MMSEFFVLQRTLLPLHRGVQHVDITIDRCTNHHQRHNYDVGQFGIAQWQRKRFVHNKCYHFDVKLTVIRII